ncbi:caspase-2-like [Haliotis rubra]|uniref:caspase-2-like n=1 Tax=Haliotis rubra TaxID=36100 RepID=UPI001EE50787|nr:caspase-2-like [Haliotis rubra]
MEAVHRDILRKNHSCLVQAIKHVEEVVDKLVQFEVLTIFMKAEIIEKPRTFFDRVRALLDTLPRRGPQAYTLFCKALEECGEIQAMTLLGLETEYPHGHDDLGGYLCMDSIPLRPRTQFKSGSIPFSLGLCR